MTYETIATLSQVSSLLLFVGLFLGRRSSMPAGRETASASRSRSDARSTSKGHDRPRGANELEAEIDEVTGVETTGHEWDGVKELNKPLRKWWLWTWYATIIWAIGYWVVYPAWPTMAGYTKGMLGYSQRQP